MFFGVVVLGLFWCRRRGVVFGVVGEGWFCGQNRVVGVSRIGLWRRSLQKTRVLGSRRLYNRSEEFLCRVIAPTPKPLSERKFSRGLKMAVLRGGFGGLELG